MKTNVGNKDRVVRIVIAAILAVLSLSGAVSGTLETLFLIVAVILLVTSLFRFCGAYALFGMNTCRNETGKEE
jgi:mannose/fructose/N-acetylgalactosamine-specific phosphotransferase system component IID